MIGVGAYDPHSWLWWSRWGGRHGSRRAGRPWWAEMMGETPPRAERGEIKYLVLEAIAEQERHGYEIIQHIEKRTGGAYRPSPGVIYPTLQLLEELGHARIVESEGRKTYAITDAGRQELEANRRTVDDFYERFDDDPWERHADEFADLMRDVARLMKLFRRASRHGNITPQTMRKIRQTLNEAMLRIEEALENR
jgi:DNA-binding PadR family transcriptional regulator